MRGWHNLCDHNCKYFVLFYCYFMYILLHKGWDFCMIHVLKTFATWGVVIDLNKNFWIHTGQWFTNRFGVTGSILDKKIQEPHDKCGRMYKIGTRLGASAIKFWHDFHIKGVCLHHQHKVQQICCICKNTR